ncbi:2-succinyl-6-hydroxy-2,4-cyclohexadiene-1-carboxylate synthase [Parafrankia irregularis]|uniref:2-succinyl-6-hydroxy-2,4-cyclohexadiene-1-carboxylate synthase n=1 Tax=Parafrankia irregularis TaxID=795642 RepID=A0A0S4QNU6_9ACTN|nr:MULTISPECIES: alpha/beta hydrolase [Parafrankia]MBE3200557.1 alpha/beta fold hydrolase [Parafrankia sp. CH37]CUU56889.1 2-succinyl-6-hydroxy-2,4-cyclohexadiene-1-carboxylate synthase [Parafrankia irregularis]
MVEPAIESAARRVEVAARRVEVAAGVELHVEDLRPATVHPDGPPVVLVHGIAGTTADWARVAPDLAATRRVIAYDQRGHGASDRADGRSSYTFDLLLTDLLALLDTLGLTAVDLIGHSMGGVVALRCALEHPGRVRSLVLVDTAAAPAAATGGVARRVVSALLEGAAAVSSAVHAARDPAPTTEATTETSAAEATTGEGRRAVGGQGAPAIVDEPVRSVHAGGSAADRALAGFDQLDPEALVALGRELGAYPSMVDRLGEIACPATVVVGEHDTTLRASAAALAQGIPAAHLAVIADADHSPHASRPLAWLAAVDVHFGRLAAPRVPGRPEPLPDQT